MLLKQFFGSRTRVKLMGLFLLHPKNEYFMTDWKAMSEQIKSKFDKPKAQAVNAQQITATERQKEYDK